MNPLNLNPKILHAIMEFCQLGGTLGGFSSIAGSFNPVAGTVCLVIAGIATVLKTNVVGNIPAKIS